MQATWRCKQSGDFVEPAEHRAGSLHCIQRMG